MRLKKFRKNNSKLFVVLLLADFSRRVRHTEADEVHLCRMLRASVQRLFSQQIRQTVYLRECLDTTAFPNTLKLYSTQTAVKDKPGTEVSEKEAEETRIGKRRPLENAPFIRELFLGRFAKVNAKKVWKNFYLI